MCLQHPRAWYLASPVPTLPCDQSWRTLPHCVWEVPAFLYALLHGDHDARCRGDDVFRNLSQIYCARRRHCACVHVGLCFSCNDSMLQAATFRFVTFLAWSARKVFPACRSPRTHSTCGVRIGKSITSAARLHRTSTIWKWASWPSTPLSSASDPERNSKSLGASP